MSTTHGKEGTLKVGANAVGELKNFSFTEQVTTADDTALGDAAETHKVGRSSWTGEAECHFDSGDTNGQNALSIGASVTANFYPEGDGSGDKYRTGTASVINRTVTNPFDGIVAIRVQLKGNGALGSATVGA
jgi:hypothetical protein